MRHLMDGRKFDRSPSNRLAMFRNLVAGLVMHGKIVTTDAKAKEVRRIAEKLVTTAKHAGKGIGKGGKGLTKKARAGRLAAYRAIRSWLPMEAYDEKGEGVNLTGKLMDEIAPRYLATAGGYTRIFKIGNRKGDNARMSLIEFAPAVEAPAKDEGKAKPKAKKGLFSALRSKKDSG